MMASVYPFLTILNASHIDCSSFTTPGDNPTQVLVIKINDENGFPLASLHISGPPDDLMRRFVNASRADALIRNLELVR